MTETPEKPKLSHGGARPNAGAKKFKPASVALRVDARLVELVEQLKRGIKTGSIDESDIDKLTRDFEKRCDDYCFNYAHKTSADYAAEFEEKIANATVNYKKRLNASIDKHGAKLKGSMGLFDLLQKCIKDAAVLIKNGVITEQEIINKFLAAHDLERFDEIETFDQWRGNRRA
jgi:hypothetical protein